jgi:hypothetical protein
MREQYIKQVRRELLVSRKKRKEIVRDLEEAFASALEHGETEEQVVERLGAPKEFIKEIEDQTGFDHAAARRKRLAGIGCLLAGAVAALALYFVIQIKRMPSNIIGQADAAATIIVSDPNAFDIAILFLVAGLGALGITAVKTIRWIRRG